MRSICEPTPEIIIAELKRQLVQKEREYSALQTKYIYLLEADNEH